MGNGDWKPPVTGYGKAMLFANDVSESGGLDWMEARVEHSPITGYDTVDTEIHGIKFHLVWNGRRFVYGHSTVTFPDGRTRKVRNVREALRIMDDRCREVLRAQGR